MYSVAGGRWEWLQKERTWGVELSAKAGAPSSVHSARRLELNVALGLIPADGQRARLELLHGWIGASGQNRLELMQSNSDLGRSVLLFSLLHLLWVLHN